MSTMNLNELESKTMDYRSNWVNWKRPCNEDLSTVSLLSYMGIAAVLVAGLGLLGSIMA